MNQQVTRDKIFKALGTIEHPEIDETLMNLGMILDVALDKNDVKVAVALPIFNISNTVKDILVKKINNPIQSMGLKPDIQFFEMTPELREKYIITAKKKWKGSKK